MTTDKTVYCKLFFNHLPDALLQRIPCFIAAVLKLFVSLKKFRSFDFRGKFQLLSFQKNAEPQLLHPQ